MRLTRIYHTSKPDYFVPWCMGRYSMMGTYFLREDLLYLPEHAYAYNDRKPDSYELADSKRHKLPNPPFGDSIMERALKQVDARIRELPEGVYETQMKYACLYSTVEELARRNGWEGGGDRAVKLTKALCLIGPEDSNLLAKVEVEVEFHGLRLRDEDDLHYLAGRLIPKAPSDAWISRLQNYNLLFIKVDDRIHDPDSPVARGLIRDGAISTEDLVEGQYVTRYRFTPENLSG